MTEEKVAWNGPTRQVWVFDGGMMTQSGTIGRAGPGGKRGEVKGWSSASRRRMREFMLLHRPKAGHDLYTVTLTVPGETITREEGVKIWAKWKKDIIGAGMSCVWRLQLQRRGQPHWHCIIGAPPGLPVKIGRKKIGDEGVGCGWFTRLWARCVGQERMAIRGAVFHACDVHKVTEEVKPVRWLRYMQDHNAGGRAYQDAEGWGRHWGVLGLRNLVRDRALLDVRLSHRQWAWLLRVLRRRNRRSIPGKCVFGFHLGYAPKRGSTGKAVWFGERKDMMRLVEFAKLCVDT